MNFIEEHQMNLLYFLLHRLKKISINAQKKIQLIENTMYHHGLIKILIKFHLQSIGDNWERFLVRDHSEKKNPEQPCGRKTLTGRKRKMETVIEREPQHQQELSEDDLPIVEILLRMKRESLRRN